MAKTFMREITQAVSKKDQSGRLAEIDREILDVTAEKTEANADFNKQLKELRKDQRAILDSIETGELRAEVEVYEEFDEERLEVLTKRADDDQVIPELTRPMSPEERQMSLGEEPAA